MKNDLQTVAEDLLARSLKIEDDLLAIEKGKAILREATLGADQALTLTSALGVVTTSRASAGTSKTVLVVDEARLTERQKAQLIKSGVLREEVKTTSGRAPSVTIRLATPVSKAA